jgi:hypothetical protein
VRGIIEIDRRRPSMLALGIDGYLLFKELHYGYLPYGRPIRSSTTVFPIATYASSYCMSDFKRHHNIVAYRRAQLYSISIY